jgi:bifunctional DNA-binding transcriptional regulator/antitoxin component of YhaV-PrlF toxin-antitoxin module
MTGAEVGTAVAVTSRGRATTPRRSRDKRHVDTPGRVRFVEDDGEVVVRAVERPSDVRGELAPEAGEKGTDAVGYTDVRIFSAPGCRTPSRDDSRRYERSATEPLREERTWDGTDPDERHGVSEREA